MDFEQLLSINFTNWALQAVALAITAFLLPGLKVTSIFGPILTVIVIALINAKVWDAALFLNIPNELTYQSLTILLSNAVIFWIVIKLLPGIEIRGLIAPIVGPVIFTFCSLLIAHYGPAVDWMKVLEYVLSFIRGLKDMIMGEEADQQAAISFLLQSLKVGS